MSKLHFSSALKVQATAETRNALSSFVDDVYFHQVIARGVDNSLTRHRDLDVALYDPTSASGFTDEWRIHFHIPLHFEATAQFGTTRDHLEGVINALAADPTLCSHIEMETYTWEVMPAAMKNRSVVDQLVAEYEWTLGALAKRGLV